MDSSLSIALFQMSPVWENSQQNLTMLAQKFAVLTEQVDVIVLPEMFSTGFTMTPSKVAQTMTGETVSWMRKQAASRNVTIVGSVVIEEHGTYFNRMVWAKPEEEPLYYDKKHLFTFAKEHHRYTAGEKQLVVNIKGWNIASFVCFDLRFPVWCRHSAKQNYDAALFIASWPKTRCEQWNALLRARAIENQSYVVAVNRVGTDGNNIAYQGDTQLLDPLGERLMHRMDDESVDIIRLEKKRLDSVRNQFPFLAEADQFRFV